MHLIQRIYHILNQSLPDLTNWNQCVHRHWVPIHILDSTVCRLMYRTVCPCKISGICFLNMVLCVLCVVCVYVYSDPDYSAWPSSIQHNWGNSHLTALPCQWSTSPRDHLGQGLYRHYLCMYNKEVPMRREKLCLVWLMTTNIIDLSYTLTPKQ